MTTFLAPPLPVVVASSATIARNTVYDDSPAIFGKSYDANSVTDYDVNPARNIYAEGSSPFIP